MEPLHITKLVRTGTSNAIVVPVNILAGLGWKRGDNLIFTFATNEQLVVRKISDEQVRMLKASHEESQESEPDEISIII